MADELFKNISDKLDKISDDMTDIKVTIAKQQVSLDDHIKRTNMLEESVEFLYDEIKPIKLHVSQVSAILKFLGIVASGITAIVGVLKLLGKV